MNAGGLRGGAGLLAHYRAILKSTFDPVLTIDADGVILAASDSVTRVFGCAPDEIVGTSLSTLIPVHFRARHEAALARHRAHPKTPLAPQTHQLSALHRDGTVFPVEVSLSRVDVPGDATPIFTGIVRDVSERTRVEEERRLLQRITIALAESRSLAEGLEAALREVGLATGWDCGEVWRVVEPLGQMADGISWAREPHAYAEFRRAGERLRSSTEHGLPNLCAASQEPVWIADLRTLPPGDFARQAEARAAGFRAAAGIPVRSDGEPVAVLLFFLRTPSPDDSRRLRLAHAAVAPLGHLIRRKAAEDELEHHRADLERTLRERAAEIERAHEQLRNAERLAAIGTLAAGLGHDVTNILFPIRCRLDALETQQLSPGAREDAAAIRRSLEYLQQLGDGLRTLIRDPVAPDSPDARTDLARWWERVSVMLRGALRDSVRFEVDIPEALPDAAVGTLALTQAVLNLVVNAGEACPADGVVRLSAAPGPGGRSVLVAVRDSGRGMTPEVLRHATDPFFTTKTRSLGTGMGLALVRGIVESCGGSIGIESREGAGTTVTLTFPGAPAEGVPSAATPGRAIAAVSIRDPRAAGLVSSFLQGAGMSVRRTAETNPAPGVLWVTEPSRAALEAAAAYLGANPRRRVVLFGRPDDAWKRLNIIVIEDTQDFQKIRRGIGDALAAVAGGAP